MRYYILHNHLTGEFWTEGNPKAIEDIVREIVEDGGDISDLLAYTANHSPLLLKETKSYTVNMSVPKGTKPKNE